MKSSGRMPRQLWLLTPQNRETDILRPNLDSTLVGGIVDAHTRDPLLAALPKQALEALARAYDDILAKYAQPVLDVAQDGRQNQRESKPAIEAEACIDRKWPDKSFADKTGPRHRDQSRDIAISRCGACALCPAAKLASLNQWNVSPSQNCRTDRTGCTKLSWTAIGRSRSVPMTN